MLCSYQSCTDTASGVHNFTKLNDTTQELQTIYQGNIFKKPINDFSDGGIYCCSRCTNYSESCCLNIGGIQTYIITCVYTYVSTIAYCMCFIELLIIR